MSEEAPPLKLREHRRRRLLSIKGLSDVAGVATQTIMDIEHGKRRARFDTMKRLSTALGVESWDVAEFRAAIREEPTDDQRTP